MEERQLTLVLMRHAKSDYPAGVADHDRPLASRGRREAALGGDWLRANAPDIDTVLCSTATRARETLACTKIDAPVSYVAQLYGATPGTMIGEINKLDDNEISTALVVGHEPTISSVALILADDETNLNAAQAISEKYPTSGIAVLHANGRWADLEPGGAALIDFHVPR